MRLEGKPVVEYIKNRMNKYSVKIKHQPVLLTLSVDPDGATLSYIRSQEKQAKQFGIAYRHLLLEKGTKREALSEIIREANHDTQINGILVSHPLPGYLDEVCILSEITPEKDIEGRTPINLGRIAYENPFFYPCTAEAVLEVLDFYHIDTLGKNVAIIGRSTTVGKPLCWMLLEKKRNATPVLCHTKTANIPSILHNADIVIVAAGSRGVVSLEDIRTGGVVIDVGITVENGKITGDVILDGEIESRKNLSVTPTPGGVGLVTSILLMEHVLKQAVEFGFEEN
jgi:methylenetetrahydrofolate dehydrogenase (NADP+)/methenyltetrahydrofolate cyclohydrolase